MYYLKLAALYSTVLENYAAIIDKSDTKLLIELKKGGVREQLIFCEEK